MLHKTILVVILASIICGTALAQTDLISIKYNGQNYICHPSSYQAYEVSTSKDEENVWYCLPTKPISAFAQAGVFGNSNTLTEIETKIIAVDPSLENSLCRGKVKWYNF